MRERKRSLTQSMNSYEVLMDSLREAAERQAEILRGVQQAAQAREADPRLNQENLPTTVTYHRQPAGTNGPEEPTRNVGPGENIHHSTPQC